MTSLDAALGAMRDRADWFLWRLEWNAALGKFEKTPCPLDRSAQRMDASNPANRTTYAAARAALRDGFTLGFWLTRECGYFLLDIDKAGDGAGNWSKFATQMVGAFPGALVEASSSGKGLHVIGRITGLLPRHRTKPEAAMKAALAPLELEFYTEGRGIAFGTTGAATGSADTFHDVVVAQLSAQYFPPVVESNAGEFSTPRADCTGPTDDDELIQRALNEKPSAGVTFGGKASFAQLWRGEVEHNSESDAALASRLAFWTGCDAPRIERLMMRSGLVRDKWRDHRTYLRTTIENACRLCERVYDYAPPAARAAMPSGDVYNMADLLVQDIPPLQWIIKKLIPQGVTLLSGDPKVGKSWLVLQMCIAVSSGLALWDKREPETQGEVLYLALEDTPRRMQARTKGMMRSLGWRIDASKFNFALDWPRGDEGVAKISAWLKEHPDCRLVVVDTIAAFRNADPGRKSAYMHDYEVGEMFKQLARDFPVAIVLVTHNRKAKGGDSHMQDISGTQGLTGSMDGYLTLRRSDKGKEGTLFANGRDAGDIPEMSLRLEQDHWQLIGNSAEVEGRNEAREIYDALRDCGGVATPREIADQLGDVKLGTVKVRLSRMVKRGELLNQKGLYSRPIPDPGPLTMPPRPQL